MEKTEVAPDQLTVVTAVAEGLYRDRKDIRHGRLRMAEHLQVPHKDPDLQ